jgi:hypothetical protein
MSNVSIFTNDIPVEARAVGVSELTKSLAGAGGRTNRRIVAKNGVFRKMVNGEEVGKLKGELNIIVVNALPSVSRVFYIEKYDPDAEATLPNCWSNLGEKPEESVSEPQAPNCQSCPQNVAGSGGGTRRACAFQRRIAIILENDPSGEVYQMNLASKTIFGKGEGRVHPFDSYTRYLAANGESIDGIVTTVSFDEDADQTKLFFTPARHLTDEELEVVYRAAATPEAKNAVRLTVAQQDGVKKLPASVTKAKVETEDDDEFMPKATKVAPKEDPIEEPVKRASSKPAPPTVKANLADVVNAWSDDE